MLLGVYFSLYQDIILLRENAKYYIQHFNAQHCVPRSLIFRFFNYNFLYMTPSEKTLVGFAFNLFEVEVGRLNLCELQVGLF